MRLINIIDDKEIETPDLDKYTDWNVRVAVRAIIMKESKVALMYVGAYSIYKLPGGGVDGDEDLESALSREIQEETGMKCEVVNKVGIFMEKRDEWKLVQISHCYLCEYIKDGESALTKEEKDTEFKLYWADNLEEAIKLVLNSKSERYDDKYIRNRDSKILKAALYNPDNAL